MTVNSQITKNVGLSRSRSCFAIRNVTTGTSPMMAKNTDRNFKAHLESDKVPPQRASASRITMTTASAATWATMGASSPAARSRITPSMSP